MKKSQVGRLWPPIAGQMADRPEIDLPEPDAKHPGAGRRARRSVTPTSWTDTEGGSMQRMAWSWERDVVASVLSHPRASR